MDLQMAAITFDGNVYAQISQLSIYQYRTAADCAIIWKLCSLLVCSKTADNL